MESFRGGALHHLRIYAKSIHSFSLGRCQGWLSNALMRVVALMAFFCSIHSFLCKCGDRMERLDRHLTSEGCNTFSMAKTSGKAQCAPYYRNTITYSTSVYYYYKSLPSKSLTINNFYVEATHSRDAPWRISILISIITMLLLLLLFILLLLLLFLLLLLLLLLLSLLLLLLLLVVVERINYSVIHMMAGIPTLTGPGAPVLTGSGTPTQTGSGKPMLTGSGTWMPTLAGPGMPTLADSRMSVLTLTSQGVPTYLDQTQHAAITCLIVFLWFYLYQMICYS